MISQHTPSPEAVDEVFHGPHSEDLAFKAWKESLGNKVRKELKEIPANPIVAYDEHGNQFAS